MDIRTIDEAPIQEGTRVLLRAGLNVPVDTEGRPTDEYRLRQALATIEYLAERKARTVVVAHLGREGTSLKYAAEALQQLTDKTVIRFFEGTIEEAVAVEVAPGECLLLENIRRVEGEKENDPVLAGMLARLGEVFVSDAFADSHRTHSSIAGVGRIIPSYAGLLMAREIEMLSKALTPPPGSVAIVGGAKFETKEPLIVKLVRLYGTVCVGGALANDFLKARGYSVATSAVSSMPVPPALANDLHIMLPIDAVLQDGASPRVSSIENVGPQERILDAGPRTIEAWNEYIAAAPLILWNGPLGVYEQGFVDGTDALARKIVERCATSNARAIVGGGDTVAALHDIHFDSEKIFCSTGGGAMLQFLADGTLPGIEVLKQ